MTFDHLPDNGSIPPGQPDQVHPMSASISNASNWITQNLPHGSQVTPGQGMNTVHVCLIPSGVHRGEVLVWDGNLTNYGVRAYQPWSIVNPYWPALNPNPWPGQLATQYRFHNGLIQMPVGQGELFCAGQAWMADGRLLVAGGTKRYPIETGTPMNPLGYEGARYVWQWDPVINAAAGDYFGHWYQMADLEVERWYPTVRYDGTASHGAIVIGGTNWQGETREVNSYEVVRTVFNASTPRLQVPPNDFDRKPAATFPSWPSGGNPVPTASQRRYWGPYVGAPSNRPGFGDYPRLHVLGILDPVSTGTSPRLFVSGFPAWGMHWAHDRFYDPLFGTFPNGLGYELGQTPANNDVVIEYAASMLLPGAIGSVGTQVARIGGMRASFSGMTESNLVETTNAGAVTSTWLSGTGTIPPMHYHRHFGNVVMLPTGDLFAIGGQHGNPFPNPTGPVDDTVFNLTPELLVGGTTWTDMAPHAGARNHHSAAILLPDARVFVCGGEQRKDVNLPSPGPGKDYAIWEPPYCHLPYGSVPPTGITVRSSATGAIVPEDAIGLLSMHYGQDYEANWTNTLERGIEVNSVVMMRPAALTHHDDGGQAMVRLVVWHNDDTSSPGNGVSFKSPASIRHAQNGWWMLFLVNSAGRPSQAYWVHLQ